MSWNPEEPDPGEIKLEREWGKGGPELFFVFLLAFIALLTALVALIVAVQW